MQTMAADTNIDVGLLLERLGHTSSFFDDSERQQAIRAAAAVTQVLHERWQATMREAVACGSPVLMIYMSDGWGVNMSQTHTLRLGDESIQSRQNAAGVCLADKRFCDASMPADKCRPH